MSNDSSGVIAPSLRHCQTAIRTPRKPYRIPGVRTRFASTATGFRTWPSRKDTRFNRWPFARNQHMKFDELLRGFSEVSSAIANGPIVPTVTPAEIRSHLDSRYDFTTPLSLEAVVADVEQMLQKWQVQVTHPRYMGLYNPSVTPA